MIASRCDRPQAIYSTFHRLRSFFERRKRARRFAIPFTRDKNWKTPRYLMVNERLEELALPNDAGTAIAFKDIFLSDVYGLETLRSPKSIIDIGAHAGLFSLAARLYFPDSVIHAYEPNPALWCSLDRQSDIGRFTVFHEAVGLGQGKGVLELGEDTVFTRCTPSPSGEIKITPISQVLRRIANNGTVDLLKLDCEGAEWEILKDSEAMINVAVLTMEYHLPEKRTLTELLQILHNLNFSVDFVHCDGPKNGRIRATRI